MDANAIITGSGLALAVNHESSFGTETSSIGIDLSSLATHTLLSVEETSLITHTLGDGVIPDFSLATSEVVSASNSIEIRASGTSSIFGVTPIVSPHHFDWALC